MPKFTKFSVGWLKMSEKKGEFVSAVLAKGNPARNQPGVKKHTIEMDDGTVSDISNFQMYFNENKQSEKAPDVEFIFVTEE